MANHEHIQQQFGRPPRVGFVSLEDWDNYISNSRSPKPEVTVKPNTELKKKVYYSTSEEEYARAAGSATRDWYYNRFGVDETPVYSQIPGEKGESKNE